MCLNVCKRLWCLLVEECNVICFPIGNSCVNWIHTNFFWKEGYIVQCHKLEFIFGKTIYREIGSLRHTVTCGQVAAKHYIIITTAEWLGAAFYRGLQQEPSEAFHAGKKVVSNLALVKKLFKTL